MGTGEVKMGGRATSHPATSLVSHRSRESSLFPKGPEASSTVHGDIGAIR